MSRMASMYEPGDYQIGIYRVVREGRIWVAYGTSWGRAEVIGKYPTLEAAHVALTGESMRD